MIRERESCLGFCLELVRVLWHDSFKEGSGVARKTN